MTVYTRQEVKKYKDYTTYKQFLRKDFYYSCVFCEIHENEHGGDWHFHVEHLRPKNEPRFHHLICEYSNLVYACDRCNTHKGVHWPSDDPAKDGVGWIDPCQDDLRSHFRLCFVNDQFTLETPTQVGKWMAETLLLNTVARFEYLKGQADEVRLDRRILELLEQLVQTNSVNRAYFVDLLESLINKMRNRFLPTIT